MRERAEARRGVGSIRDIEALNRRILVIDDNPAIHEDFRKIFCRLMPSAEALSQSEAALFGETQTARDETAGDDAQFEMDCAFQGQEALKRVTTALRENRPYAMAFLDVRMPPGWDGIETATRIWQQDPQLQIVLCTAYSDYSWEDMRARLGRSDRLVILKKPFDTVEVLQLADTLTEKWRVTEQAALKMSALEQAVEERTRELRQANQALQAEIVERKLLENQLVQAQKLESIGQLAAGIAHEINTPIQYVGDSVEFLRSSVASIEEVLGQYRLLHATADAGDAVEVLAHAQSAAEAADLEFLHTEIPRAFERTLDGVARVAKIVRAMKEFSFPDAHEHSYTDVNHALGNTLVVARNEYKLLATIDTQLGELPEVKCNISELNQVFLNLIVNAAHAIQESGKDASTGVIAIRTSEVGGGMVEVAISDNGCGIATEHVNKVFEPFFTTKEVGRGTGQGLAIARAAVVTRHGGTLSFETDVGRGTTFFVRVPIHGASEALRRVQPLQTAH